MPRERTDEMNSVFDEFFGRGLSDFLNQSWTSSSPSVNVTDQDDNYLIEVAAPGLERKDFDINLKDNTLIVEVEKEVDSEENDEKVIRREFNYTRFERHFQMPENVNVENISATYKNGVLNINLPKVQKKEEESVKRIEIA